VPRLVDALVFLTTIAGEHAICIELRLLLQSVDSVLSKANCARHSVGGNFESQVPATGRPSWNWLRFRSQPTPFWNSATHHFRSSLFSRLRGPHQSAWNNLAPVWTSTPEAGRSICENRRGKRECARLCGINANHNQNKLRTKGRVPNTYQITAYRQFPAFVACIFFNNFFVFSKVSEFKSPSGYHISYLLSIIYEIIECRSIGCIPMKTKRRKTPEMLLHKVWVGKQMEEA
jgi:hypothetical protein